MDETTNLRMPYLMAAEAQKHVTHNEALRTLDALVQLSVIDRDLTGPPGTPAEGDRYIPAATATGAWAGKEDNIAAYLDGAWMFYTPKAGWIAWLVDEAIPVIWDGGSWVQLTLEAAATASLFGINTTADTTNRLAVKSDAVLFSHDDVTPGNDDIQVKVNKKATGDTGSHLFQTGFSGRAEFGLIGDDDFTVKVSPDGTVWYDGIVVDKDDGSVAFPNSSMGFVSRQVFSSGSGTYTTPSGINKILIRAWGAGGGGGGGSGNTTGGGTGGTGGATTFGSIVSSPGGAGGAGGGNGGNRGNGGAGGAGGSLPTLGDVKWSGSPGDSSQSASSDFAGQAAAGAGAYGGGAPGSFQTAGGAASNPGGGGGGGGAVASPSRAGGAGGGSGAYTELLVISPDSSYSYTVGSGGAAGTAGTGGAPGAGGAGGNGFIIVEEYT